MGSDIGGYNAMNLKYLGDTLDHWKGSVFQILQEAKLLRNLEVDAMMTDSDLCRTVT